MPAKNPDNAGQNSFLLAQPFWRAEGGDAAARWDLACREDEPSAEGDKREDSAFWQRINRDELLQMAVSDEADCQRVGFVCAAGLGKSTNLGWLEAAVNALNNGFNGNLAFFLELRELPEKRNALLELMVERIHTRVHADEATLRQGLLRKLATGKVTFLLDSLDQADPNPTGPVIAALKALATGVWGGCRIWVSGRPYAFRTARTKLEGMHANLAWRFLRIGQLDEAACRQLLETTKKGIQECYPQPHVYGQLEAAGKRLARIPRYGRLIAKLRPEEFAKLQTDADTYWYPYNYVDNNPTGPTDSTGLLDDGLKVRAGDAYKLGWHEPQEPDRTPEFRRFQVRLAGDMLGALAFRMFCAVDGSGQPQPAFVIDKDVDAFQNQVSVYFKQCGAYLDDENQPINDKLFRKDWNRLKAMNSHGMEHLILNANDQGIIRFADPTLQAFFAAYWACRWATDDDRKLMRRWVIDPVEGTNPEFQEFWTFAAEMPEDAVERGHWIDLMGLFYDRSRWEGQEPIRSTEFIYRSWLRMEK